MELIFRLFDRLPIEVVLGIPALVIALLAILILAVWETGRNNIILLEMNKAFEAIGGTPQSPKLSTFDRMATLLYLRVCYCICVLKLRYNVRRAEQVLQQLRVAGPKERYMKEILTVVGFMIGAGIFAPVAMWYFSQLGNGLLIAHGSHPDVLPGWMYPSVTIGTMLIGWLAGMAVNEGRASTHNAGA